jgi:hypothetical protein
MSPATAPAPTAVKSDVPNVQPGDLVFYRKNSSSPPVAAFVTRQNVNNTSLALSLVMPYRGALVTSSDLMCVPHSSAPNAINAEVNKRGYWDLTDHELEFRAMRNKVAVLESQVQQLLAAITNPGK